MDGLIIDVATTPATTFTVPISWTLSGAVLSLPQAGGPLTDAWGQAFYIADSTSGSTLPMDNSGTVSVTVDFALQPSGRSRFSQSHPSQYCRTREHCAALVSTGVTTSCPTTTNGTATFVYSGPVCQPFPVQSVNIHSCAGTY